MGAAGRAEPLGCLNVLKKGNGGSAKGWRGAQTVGGSSHLDRADSPVWRGCRAGALSWWATSPGGHGPLTWGQLQAGAGTAGAQGSCYLHIWEPAGTWTCFILLLPIIKNLWKIDTKNEDVKATKKI